MKAAFLFLFFFFIAPYCQAEGLFSRANSTAFTICSQNLERYGSRRLFLKSNAELSSSDFERKQKAIVTRIFEARCDAVALQEVLGKNKREAEESAESLASAVSEATGKKYDAVVGETNDEFIRVGFLIDKSSLSLEKVIPFSDDELPKLSQFQRPRFFARLPLQVNLRAQLRNGSNRPLRLVTFHMKSKSGGMKDPAGLMWETVRMESAEKLRTLIENNDKEAFQTGGPLLFVLGDRNSDEESATAEIMDGKLHLSSFQSPDPPCMVAKAAKVLCRKGYDGFSPVLFSVFSGDPDTKNLPGTHTYKNTASWLDDIVMPVASLEYALEDPSREGDYDSGIISAYPEASDHALVYVRVRL